MASPSTPRTRLGLLGAGLLIAAAAAQAATGYTIERGQEALVQPGMSTAAVEAALGRPSEQLKYGNEPGPTFSYQLLGAPDTRFDVDFGADGTVASVGERPDVYGAGHGGLR